MSCKRNGTILAEALVAALILTSTTTLIMMTVSCYQKQRQQEEARIVAVKQAYKQELRTWLKEKHSP
ncbi:hypothetical protein [Weissella cibaria]|uniref:hypothetical protein n=1 Tax=Weissella cibaria TaxID=137591 RepID=UPI00106E3B4E|nr:hypothetical protein [Weissella cibaria]